MKRILFFGDSNTYGYDPRQAGGRYPASVRWTDRLTGAFAGRLEILPCGLNGRCIPQSTEERAFVESMLQNVGEGDIFAVMLGTNDVILTTHPDADVAADRMRKFLSWLLEKELPCRILLIAPPAMAAESEQLPEYEAYYRETKRLCALYEQLAKKMDIAFVNADAWQIPMAFDYVHFSEEGHRLFAEHMQTVLEETGGIR